MNRSLHTSAVSAAIVLIGTACLGGALPAQAAEPSDAALDAVFDVVELVDSPAVDQIAKADPFVQSGDLWEVVGSNATRVELQTTSDPTITLESGHGSLSVSGALPGAV